MIGEPTEFRRSSPGEKGSFTITNSCCCWSNGLNVAFEPGDGGRVGICPPFRTGYPR